MLLSQIDQMLEQYGIIFLTERKNAYPCFLSPIEKETAQNTAKMPMPFCSNPSATYHMVYSVTVSALSKGSKIAIHGKDYLVTGCDCYYLGESPIYQWATLRLLGESEESA